MMNGKNEINSRNSARKVANHGMQELIENVKIVFLLQMRIQHSLSTPTIIIETRNAHKIPPNICTAYPLFVLFIHE